MTTPHGITREQRIVVVTGASRGIGAETARQLASPDTHVIVTYREKVKRARAVVDDITSAGGSGCAARADISDPSDCATLVQYLREEFGRVNALVLNASGGLELGVDPGYPMRINRDAQVGLTRLMLPLMPARGRIVFVTSHQAHFHGVKPVPEDYIPIAESKRAGEDALRGMRAELEARQVSLSVVSGDMIDETIIVRLLHRRDPAAVDARRAHGPLPTIEEFAAAIVDATIGAGSGADTVYVGGADYLQSVN